MSLRLDHLVVAVADLAEAQRAAGQLGFQVHGGGNHPGRGTHNALIALEVGYVELLALRDATEARAAGPKGQVLADVVGRHRACPLGYALSSDDLDAAATRLHQGGVDADGPYPMQRRRPDGGVLSWRLLVPGGVAWRRPWPQLIDWDTPPTPIPPAHDNGIVRAEGIVVAVRDLAAGRRFYEDHLGLVPDARHDGRVWFRLDGFGIELVSATATDELGEGVCAIILGTVDLDVTRRAFQRAGVVLEPTDDGGRELLVRPSTGVAGRLLVRQIL